MYWNTAVFSTCVTRRAKANEIAQAIGILVVVIFLWNVAVLTKWSDMMNVQFATYLSLTYATVAALVTIALTGAACLSPPVRAVVLLLPSLPYRTIFSTEVLIVTFLSTEVALTHLGRFKLDGFSAKVTLFFNSLFPKVVIFTSHVARHPGYTARCITECTFVMQEGRDALYHTAALVTRYRDALYPVRMILASKILTMPSTFAFSAAKIIAVGIYLVGVASKFFTAFVTVYRKPTGLFPLFATLHATKYFLARLYIRRCTANRFVALPAGCPDCQGYSPAKQPLDVARTCDRPGSQEAVVTLSQYLVYRAKYPVGRTFNYSTSVLNVQELTG